MKVKLCKVGPNCKIYQNKEGNLFRLECFIDSDLQKYGILTSKEDALSLAHEWIKTEDFEDLIQYVEGDPNDFAGEEYEATITCEWKTKVKASSAEFADDIAWCNFLNAQNSEAGVDYTVDSESCV